jgi:hypothetical protein
MVVTKISVNRTIDATTVDSNSIARSIMGNRKPCAGAGCPGPRRNADRALAHIAYRPSALSPTIKRNANNGPGKKSVIVIGNTNAPSNGSKREPNQWLARQAIMDPAKKNPNE